jgi:hypothetical protein
MSAKEKINSLRRLKKESLERYNERLGPEKEPRYDKTQFCFSDKPSSHNLHNIIYFCHHSGVLQHQNLLPYIVGAINEMKEKIFHHALKLIDKDIDGLIGDLKAEREGLDNLIKELANKEES